MDDKKKYNFNLGAGEQPVYDFSFLQNYSPELQEASPANNNDDDNLLEAGYHGVLGGAGNFIRTLGNMMNYAGKPANMTEEEYDKRLEKQGGLFPYANKLNKEIEAFGKGVEDAHARKYSDPLGANSIANAVGSVVPYAIGLGLSAKMGAPNPYETARAEVSAAAAAQRIAPFLNKIAGKYGEDVAAAAPGYIAPVLVNATLGQKQALGESLFESFSSGKMDYIEKAKRNKTYVPGVTEVQAEKVAKGVLTDNLMFITGTDTLQEALMSLTGQGKVGKVAKLLTASGVNAAQEVGQQIFPKAEAGENWSFSDPDVVLSGIAGAITGGVPHAAGTAYDSLFPNSTDVGTINGMTISDIDSANNEKGTLVDAIAGQESGGNYDATNARTGASGKYQIMPENWSAWSKEAGLPDGAEMTPENQEIVARFKLNQYQEQYGAEGAAVAWYAGPANAERWVNGETTDIYGVPWDAPQHQNEPSIKEYVESVMGRMGQGGSSAATSPNYKEAKSFLQQYLENEAKAGEEYNDIEDLISTGSNEDVITKAIELGYGQKETPSQPTTQENAANVDANGAPSLTTAIDAVNGAIADVNENGGQPNLNGLEPVAVNSLETGIQTLGAPTDATDGVSNNGNVQTTTATPNVADNIAANGAQTITTGQNNISTTTPQTTNNLTVAPDPKTENKILNLRKGLNRLADNKGDKKRKLSDEESARLKEVANSDDIEELISTAREYGFRIGKDIENEANRRASEARNALTGDDWVNAEILATTKSVKGNNKVRYIDKETGEPDWDKVGKSKKAQVVLETPQYNGIGSKAMEGDQEARKKLNELAPLQKLALLNRARRAKAEGTQDVAVPKGNSVSNVNNGNPSDTNGGNTGTNTNNEDIDKQSSKGNVEGNGEQGKETNGSGAGEEVEESELPTIEINGKKAEPKLINVDGVTKIAFSYPQFSKNAGKSVVSDYKAAGFSWNSKLQLHVADDTDKARAFLAKYNEAKAEQNAKAEQKKPKTFLGDKVGQWEYDAESSILEINSASYKNANSKSVPRARIDITQGMWVVTFYGQDGKPVKGKQQWVESKKQATEVLKREGNDNSGGNNNENNSQGTGNQGGKQNSVQGGQSEPTSQVQTDDNEGNGENNKTEEVGNENTSNENGDVLIASDKDTSDKNTDKDAGDDGNAGNEESGQNDEFQKPYYANFDQEEYDNFLQLVKETNEEFGTHYEVKGRWFIDPDKKMKYKLTQFDVSSVLYSASFTKEEAAEVLEDFIDLTGDPLEEVETSGDKKSEIGDKGGGVNNGNNAEADNANKNESADDEYVESEIRTQQLEKQAKEEQGEDEDIDFIIAQISERLQDASPKIAKSVSKYLRTHLEEAKLLLDIIDKNPRILYSAVKDSKSQGGMRKVFYVVWEGQGKPQKVSKTFFQAFVAIKNLNNSSFSESDLKEAEEKLATLDGYKRELVEHENSESQEDRYLKEIPEDSIGDFIDEVEGSLGKDVAAQMDDVLYSDSPYKYADGTPMSWGDKIKELVFKCLQAQDTLIFEEFCKKNGWGNSISEEGNVESSPQKKLFWYLYDNFEDRVKPTARGGYKTDSDANMELSLRISDVLDTIVDVLAMDDDVLPRVRETLIKRFPNTPLGEITNEDIKVAVNEVMLSKYREAYKKLPESSSDKRVAERRLLLESKIFELSPKVVKAKDEWHKAHEASLADKDSAGLSKAKDEAHEAFERYQKAKEQALRGDEKTETAADDTSEQPVEQGQEHEEQTVEFDEDLLKQAEDLLVDMGNKLFKAEEENKGELAHYSPDLFSQFLQLGAHVLTKNLRRATASFEAWKNIFK